MKNLTNSLSEKSYKYNDSAPLFCGECQGCCDCCRGMGDTILQDPYDYWNFTSHMNVAGGSPVTFELLISEDGPWELSIQDGVLLPNLKMVEDGRCPFLNGQGRCSIHPIRSGLCRLYPLARIFHPADEAHPLGSVSYKILDGELGCKKNHGQSESLPVKDWLGIPGIESYEAFQLAWHKVRKDMAAYAKTASPENLQYARKNLLRIFYGRPYRADFFTDFQMRLKRWNRMEMLAQ